MKKIFTMRRYLLTALFFYSLCFFSQENYFQQEVNYTISVELNDSLHILRGTEEIKYTNNSPQALSFIYFHLWPNAYRQSNTALGKQMLRSGNTSLYFSQQDDRGGIDSLTFRVDGEKVSVVPDSVHSDICKLILKKPLQTGSQITITTPFKVKVPDAKFSRLGHTGQAYFITQWYPKPAVYDAQGWHPMPYLDQGEFYSEYGSFDVRITLPDNYFLAATGDRRDAAGEEAFIENRIRQTKTFFESADTAKVKELMVFPPSSRTKKTVRFFQKNVHDFAWVADKRFYILKGEVELPQSKRKVMTWAYFTAKNSKYWKKAVGYINDATLFYSKNVGEYPYDHVTAVDGTIMAGGGMEYPNITIIGDVGSDIDLDIVITHEVGHNWFYGILGSNERDFPFLDEGINSFYEMRYCREKYPTKKLTEFIGKDSTFRLLGLNKVPYWKFHEVLYNLSLHAGADQPVDLPATAYSGFNYGSVIYSKTPMLCDYLMDVMGTEKFDEAMHDYFTRHKFTHPTPSDFYRSLTQKRPELHEHLPVLFSGNERVDYKFSSARKKDGGTYSLKIRNKGRSALPFSIYALNGNHVSDTLWVQGFSGKKKIDFVTTKADRFKIDGADRMNEWNRKNNTIRTSGIFKKSEPLRLNFITRMDDPKRTHLHYLPVAGYNVYSHIMVGVSLHNYGFIPKQFQFAFTPMLSIRATRPLGFIEMNYNFHPQKFFQTVSVGVKAKSFAYDELRDSPTGYEWNEVPLQFYYFKVAPFVKFNLKSKSLASTVSQEFGFTANILFTDSQNVIRSSEASLVAGKKITNSVVNKLQYEFANKRALDPYRIGAGIQQSGSMLKASAVLGYNVTFSPKRNLYLRFFLGGFLKGTQAERNYYSFRASGYTGSQDYLFDHNFVARNESNGFGFSQFAEEDGAMKVWSALGQSPEWLASVNIKSPRFLKFFRVYADVVSSDLRYMGDELVLWDAGLNISIVRDIIEVYLPVIYSNSIRQNRALNNQGWYDALRFTFNIHKLEPGKIIQNNIF